MQIGFPINKRADFDEALIRFAAHEGVEKVTSSTPVRLTSGSGSLVTLELASQTIQSQFLIDGTGISSQLVAGLKSQRLRFDRLVGLLVPIANLSTSDRWMRLAASSAGW